MTISRTSLTRHGWVIAACVVLVTAGAAILARHKQSYYEAQSSVVVSDPGNQTPGTAAGTYSEVIASDEALLNAIGRALGYPAAVVASRISATQQTGTAIINIGFRDPSPKLARLGNATALRGVTGNHPIASGIPSGALQIVKSTGAPFEQGDRLPGGPLPVGIVLGLILGIAIFLVWERADARADDWQSLERELAMPVSVVNPPSATSRSELMAIQQRWFDLAGRPQGPAAVALVDATAESTDLRISVLDSIEDARLDCVRFLPSPNGDCLRAAMNADAVVLLVGVGDRLAAIRRRIESLRKLGAEPQWALLARRRR